MVQKAVTDGSFEGFHVNQNLSFSLLQFADDTILVGKGMWDKLWSIKSIFRSFEFISGLKVNFFNSHKIRFPSLNENLNHSDIFY